MATDIINNDLYINGGLTVTQGVTLPAGAIGNAAIAAGAGIDETKVSQQPRLHYAQAPGTAVVAATEDLHIVYGATGTLTAIKAAVTGAIATGADRTVTVDLQKSTGAGAFATVLSSPISFNNADVLRTAKSGTVSVTGLVVGDILRVVVAVAGSAGAQAQGLQVTVTLKEAAA